MAKTLGYMVTWTTYGTWLQGDERGYIRNGKICGRNPGLEQRNKEKQTGNTIKLTNKQKNIVRKAIIEEARKLGQIVHSIAVFRRAVHTLPLPLDLRKFGGVRDCGLEERGVKDEFLCKFWVKAGGKRKFLTD